jgi:glycosyltransferase involved in cell wall biosynthesis
MKVLVVTSDVPFARGGHRVIARSLVDALLRLGVEAESFTTPQNRFGRQAAAYLATRLTDVGLTASGERVDQIVTLRFPAYALRHERHVCWLLHRMREYYDLWPRHLSGLTAWGRGKERVRRFLIHRADSHLLRRVSRLFALSGAVSDGLQRFGGLASEVLHPPPPPRPYRCESFEPFVFAPSRLHPTKRLDLLVEALARARDAGLSAVVAGEGEEREHLLALVRERGLESRCRLVGRVDEGQLVDYYGRCRAVFFAPFNEDFGFVAAEAFASGKPVVTCTDAGGARELVDDGISGYVVAPDAGAIASALDRLAADPGLSEKLGQAGRERVMPLSWEATAERLLLG